MKMGRLLIFVSVVFLSVIILAVLSSENLLQISEVTTSLINFWNHFSEVLTQNGFLLFLAIIVLPAFILPVSPLLALAGIWGAVHGALNSAIYGTIALTINCCWTYWLARILGAKFNEKFNFFTKKIASKIPQQTSKNILGWALILRLTPGIPFIFSNYILGAIKMPFISYLAVSVPILTATASGYILTTSGIISGDLSTLGGGIAFLVGIILFGKYILNKSKYAN